MNIIFIYYYILKSVIFFINMNVFSNFLFLKKTDNRLFILLICS